MDFLNALDVKLFYFINRGLENNFFDLIMPIITNVRYWRIPLIIIFLSLFIWGNEKGKKTFLLCLITLILSDQVSSRLLKPLFHRLRPYKVLDDVHQLVGSGGFSLPSSHAANIFAMAMVITYIWRRLWIGILVFGIAVVVGFSRVYVGVHYPLDVAAGVIVGGVCVLLSIQIFKGFKWEFLKRKRASSKSRSNAGLE